MRSTFHLIADAYYSEGNLYLLINENVGDDFEFISNKIIVIGMNDSNTPIIKKTYILDGDLFQQIAVSNKSMYAYNHSRSSIDEFLIE